MAWYVWIYIAGAAWALIIMINHVRRKGWYREPPKHNTAWSKLGNRIYWGCVGLCAILFAMIFCPITIFAKIRGYY